MPHNRKLLEDKVEEKKAVQLQRQIYGGWQLFINKFYLQRDGNNIRNIYTACWLNRLSKYRLKTTLKK